VNPSTAQVAKDLATTLEYTRQEYAALYALQPPASLVALHRIALWALWKLNAMAADEIKQMQSGTDWMTAEKAHGATKLQLVGRWFGAWSSAGVAVCGGGIDISVHFGK